jgi:hypothetical protein
MAGMTRHEIVPATIVLLAIGVAACDEPPAGPSRPILTPTPEPRATLVSGWVGDTATRVIAGARVEVMTGARAGTAVVTDGTGRFAIEQPLDRDVQVRASMPGYVDEIQVVGWGGTTGTKWMDFRLRSPNGSVDLTGRHRITFTADAACTDLPPIARVRTYLANVGSITGLYGANFGGVSTPGNPYPWNVLYLSQFDDYALFNVQDPPVWELLPDNAYVVIYGDASGTVSSHGGTLMLTGFFSYCPRMKPGEYPSCMDPETTCQSSRHHMTVARQY